MNDRREARDRLSSEYADLLGAYQQAHHNLMDMLRDNEISFSAFRAESDRLHQLVDALKTMKLELLERRRALPGREDQ